TSTAHQQHRENAVVNASHDFYLIDTRDAQTPEALRRRRRHHVRGSGAIVIQVDDRCNIGYRWQATQCSGSTSVKTGSTCRQISMAMGQRDSNRKPGGGSRGFGTSPMSAGGRTGASGSATGSDASKACV